MARIRQRVAIVQQANQRTVHEYPWRYKNASFKASNARCIPDPFFFYFFRFCED